MVINASWAIILIPLELVACSFILIGIMLAKYGSKMDKKICDWLDNNGFKDEL